MLPKYLLYANDVIYGCQPLNSFRIGLITGKTGKIRGLGLLVSPPTCREGGGLNRSWSPTGSDLVSSSLCNEASIKIQGTVSWELQDSWTCGDFWRWPAWRGTEGLHPSHVLHPVHLPSVFFVLNWWTRVSLTSLDHLANLEVIWDKITPGLWLASEVLE